MTNKIKPFAINCTTLTFGQVVEIVEKSVKAGAIRYEVLTLPPLK